MMRSVLYILAIMLVPVCILWVDRPLSRWVARWLPPGRTLPDAPDVLVPAVVIVSILMLLLWIWSWPASRRHRRLAHLAPQLAFGLPLTLGLKTLAKWIFGRTETRMYLSTYHSCDFCHWLDGFGPFRAFPSGHMLVATVALTLIVASYPRLRYIAWGLLLALAIALVATSYHFVSDIIAGWLFGHAFAWLILRSDAGLRSVLTAQTQP